MITNKIISGPSIYKVQSHIKAVGVKNSSPPKKNVLTTLLRKITNSSINLKRELLVKFLPKNEAQNINNFTHRERVQVVDSKTVKEFMTQKLHELDLSGKGKEDPVYASQACDAILASVYSNKKDQYCKMLISKGVDTSAFLKEAGEVASDMGLAGKMHHDIFTPSGAGANPFLTAIFSSAQQKYMHMFMFINGTRRI